MGIQKAEGSGFCREENECCGVAIYEDVCFHTKSIVCGMLTWQEIYYLFLESLDIHSVETYIPPTHFIYQKRMCYYCTSESLNFFLKN